METSIVKRAWIPKQGYQVEVGREKSNLRLMTYNILGDGFIQVGEYTYCPRRCRFLGNRHQRILQEISYISPDVLCLQEVSKSHFDNHLVPDMGDLGYQGIHTPHKHNDSRDGLAIFFRSNILALIDQEISLSSERIKDYLKQAPKQLGPSEEEDIIRLTQRGLGCLLAKFRLRSNGKTLSIGNIHIKWTCFTLPGLACFEAACAVQALKAFSGDDNFILTGDFNSTPDYAPYSVMNTGRIDHNNIRWELPKIKLYPWDGDVNSPPNLSHSISVDDIIHTPASNRDSATDRLLVKILQGNTMQPNTALKSAYYEVVGHEPLVSNCDAYAWPGFIHELGLDYIWYNSDHMIPVKVLKMPSRDIIRQEHGLPSSRFPSDHLPLAAIFKLV